MAIVKLTGFIGTADVLGLLREVRFEDGCLSIAGLDLVDAHAIINRLSTGTMAGAAVPEPLAGALAGTLPPDALKAADKVKAQSSGSQANGKHPTVKGAVSGPADGAGIKDPTGGVLTAPSTSSASSPIQASAPSQDVVGQAALPGGLAVASDNNVVGPVETPPNTVTETAAEPDKSTVPEHIRNAKRLTIVVDYFKGLGAKDAEAITKECLAIKDQVPLLGRIPNMLDRVKSALEAAG